MDFGPVYAAHLSYACLLAILLDLCTLVSEAIYESLSSLGQLLGDLIVTLRHMLAWRVSVA